MIRSSVTGCFAAAVQCAIFAAQLKGKLAALQRGLLYIGILAQERCVALNIEAFVTHFEFALVRVCAEQVIEKISTCSAG